MVNTKGQIIAYLRVSSEGQNLDRQFEVKNDADKCFEEKASAGTRDRPQLKAMMEWARDGDRVRVWSMDRLARSMRDMSEIVEELNNKGVAVEFVKEGLTFDPYADDIDPFKKLLFQILGSFAEFERSIIRERQREGIAKAKAEGKYKGRKSVIDPEVVEHAKKRKEDGVSISLIARELGISRASVYKALTI